jgi:RimJ/RimL family protein N-acetyltransferase
MRFPSFTLQTGRLVLRGAATDDTQALYEAVVESQADLAAHFWWARNPSLEQTGTDIARMCSTWVRHDVAVMDRFAYFIYAKSTGALVGVISLTVHDTAIPMAELGYWVRTSAQGQGFITEAATELVRHALDDLGVRRLQIRCNTSNASSARIAHKLNFQYEGTLRQSYQGPYGLIDMMVFSRIV